MKAVQRKKKKPLAERIAEKEAARAEAEKKEVQLIDPRREKTTTGDMKISIDRWLLIAEWK